MKNILALTVIQNGQLADLLHQLGRMPRVVPDEIVVGDRRERLGIDEIPPDPGLLLPGPGLEPPRPLGHELAPALRPLGRALAAVVPGDLQRPARLAVPGEARGAILDGQQVLARVAPALAEQGQPFGARVVLQVARGRGAAAGGSQGPEPRAVERLVVEPAAEAGEPLEVGGG